MFIRIATKNFFSLLNYLRVLYIEEVHRKVESFNQFSDKFIEGIFCKFYNIFLLA